MRSGWLFTYGKNGNKNKHGINCIKRDLRISSKGGGAEKPTKVKQGRLHQKNIDVALFSDGDFIIHSHTAHLARSALVHPVIVGGSHDAAGPEILVLQPFSNPACKRYHLYPTLASNLLGNLLFREGS